MFNFLLGLGGNKIKEAIRNGAVIIDVRTANEFDRGRVPGSLNIPVDRIALNIARIKSMKKPIVLCCESGRRSGSAKQVLKANGVKDVFNGGSWQSVLKISKQF